MSLLLDALKKAAEQKARQEGSDSDPSIANPEITTSPGYEADYSVDVSESSDIQQPLSEQSSDHETESAEMLIAGEPETGIDLHPEPPAAIASESVDFDQPEDSELADSSVIIDTGDDTLQPSFDEDETMSLLSNDDVSEFLGNSNETEEAVAEDEDLSLSLVELDQEDISDNTPGSASSLGSDIQMLAENQGRTNHLKQVDYVAEGGKPITITDVELETLRNEPTVSQHDTLATRTDVSDNYDRSLIKPMHGEARFSSDAGGADSEGTVSMTPEYAKRVFLSKSSANQAQNTKIYIGITVSILLSIVFFSMFEFQDQYDKIETTLRPLKRDPLPGSIKIPDTETSIQLFQTNATPDADIQTFDNVASASSIKDESLSNTPEDSALTTPVNVDKNINSKAIEKLADVTGNSDRQIKIKSTSTKSLQISSNQKMTDKDLWIKQAYLAYQQGDDTTALKIYNQVLEVDPDNRNALLARAAITIQQRDSVSAIKDYQRLLVINPKDSLAMSSLISVANIAPQASESQLKLMIRDEPDSPYLNFVLANVYSTQNRWQEAQGFYFKALENNPQDPNYAYNLAVSLEHIAKPKVAIDYYQKALDNFGNGLATFNKDIVNQRITSLRQL